MKVKARLAALRRRQQGPEAPIIVTPSPSGPELHVVVLWPAARPAEERILSHLEDHLHIRDVVEVHWSAGEFRRNMARFYGIYLRELDLKLEHCGIGPFLVAVVEDDTPVYEPRATTRGRATVNAKLFDAKKLYREWTGGGHRIHASNDPAEAEHDLLYLLRRRTAFYRDEQSRGVGDVDVLTADLPGADGWPSAAELFEVLGVTMEYVLLDQTDGLEILTRDLGWAALTVNSEARSDSIVRIGDEELPLGLQTVGDGGLDRRWQERLLASRELDESGVFVLPVRERFYVLLYDAVTTGSPEAAAVAELEEIREAASAPAVDYTDEEARRRVLDEFMRSHGYSRGGQGGVLKRFGRGRV